MGELIVSTDVLPLDFWHKLGRWSDPLLSDLMGERENGDCHFDACSTLMRTTFTADMIFVKTFTLADFGPVISPESA